MQLVGCSRIAVGVHSQTYENMVFTQYSVALLQGDFREHSSISVECIARTLLTMKPKQVPTKATDMCLKVNKCCFGCLLYCKCVRIYAHVLMENMLISEFKHMSLRYIFKNNYKYWPVCRCPYRTGI